MIDGIQSKYLVKMITQLLVISFIINCKNQWKNVNMLHRFTTDDQIDGVWNI